MINKEKIDHKASVYARVYARLSEHIEKRLLKGDLSLLPSEVKLSQNYGCSRVTIRRVLESLEEERRIRKYPGKGTVPVPRDKRDARNTSGKIAVYVVPSALTSPDFPSLNSREVLDTVDMLVKDPHQNIELCSQLTDPVNFDPRNFPEWVKRHDVRAMVVKPLPGQMDALAECAQTSGCPIVVWSRHVWSDALHCVSVDYYNDIRRAMELLRNFGHRRIAFIGVEGNNEPTCARWQAYRDVMAKLGETRITPICPGPRYVDVYNFTKDIIAQEASESPTVIMTLGEYFDWPCLQAISDSRLKIPEEISFLATDDFVQSQYYCPPISVIRQPVVEMITKTVQLARQAADNPGLPPQRIMLDSEIVIRKSVSYAKS